MAKFNIAKIVTHSFLGMVQKCLREGIPWQTPFIRTGIPISAATGDIYSGINVFQLLMSSYINEFTDPRWGTYNRWKTLGGQVKKGSRSTMAIYYKLMPYEITNEKTGETVEAARPLMRYYSLFNAEQCNGIEPLETEETSPARRFKVADKYLNSAGADVTFSTQPPFYNYKKDYINLLHAELYKDTKHATATESFYSSWTHELTHWTGAKDRNNRPMKGDKYSDEYAYEELIAEFGAILLCNKLDITLEPKLANATYLASWLKRLKKDDHALMRATRQAQKAVDYIDQQVNLDTQVQPTGDNNE